MNCRVTGRRMLGTLGLLLVSLVVLLLAGAAAALAHSSLLSSDPAQGSEVAVAPTRVTLTFSEPVGIGPGSIVVVDPRGSRVDAGEPRHVEGAQETVQVDLRPGLPDASYAVLWHVASADTHPVSGSFTFGVGGPAGAAPAAPAGDRAVSALHWALVALWYLGATLLIGTGMFVAVLWPGGRDRPAVRRLMWTGIAVAGTAVAGLYVVQGPYGQGRGPGSLVDPGLLGDTLRTNAGPLLLERLGVVLMAAPVTWLWPRREPARELSAEPSRPDGRAGAVWQTLLLGLVLALTSALAGHPGQQSPVLFAVAADGLHFLAATCWIGGLVCLAIAFLPVATPAELDHVLPRWSRLAMAAVGTLVITGTYQAWRQIGSVAAFTGTGYGRVLILKLAGLMLALALAELGRRWIRARADRHRARPVRALRESVLAEVGVGVAVLGITAALVATVPARQSYPPPFSASLQATGVDGSAITVVLKIPDTRPGVQSVYLSTRTAGGRVQPFLDATGSLEERSEALGPIRFGFAATGPGEGTAIGVPVPGEGSWTMTLQVRTAAATAYGVAVSYPVRAG